MKSVTTRIWRPTPRNLAFLAGVLRRGGAVAVPTETVYGLAASAWDAEACRSLFRIKRRPANDPLIVHVADMRMLDAVAVANEAAMALASAFWPGPLTLVLPRRPGIPDVVTSGLPTVAVRMPAHPLMRRLLRLTGLPLAAPSANPFGYVSPTTAAHVREGLRGRLGHILDGGSCRIGVESTIIDLSRPGRPRLLRPGGVSAGEIEAVLGRRLERVKKVRAGAAAPAPGMMHRHYSPGTPLFLVGRLPDGEPPEGTGWLRYMRPPGRRAAATGRHRWLTTTGGQAQAARALFGVLRALDRAGLRRIEAETAPEGPLADAINDRLRRAAAG